MQVALDPRFRKTRSSGRGSGELKTMICLKGTDAPLSANYHHEQMPSADSLRVCVCVRMCAFKNLEHSTSQVIYRWPGCNLTLTCFQSTEYLQRTTDREKFYPQKS